VSAAEKVVNYLRLNPTPYKAMMSIGIYGHTKRSIEEVPPNGFGYILCQLYAVTLR